MTSTASLSQWDWGSFQPLGNYGLDHSTKAWNPILQSPIGAFVDDR
jgi:hypothetical protein